MAENRKGKDKRYYFTFGQMVLLGGAFIFTSIIIFFLGIFVGKQIESRKMIKPEEPLIKVPVKPSAGSATAPSAQAKEEMTFYDTLKRSPGAEPTAEVKREKPARTEAKPRKAETKNGAPAGRTVEKKTGAPVETINAKTAKDAAEHKADGKAWTVQVNAYPDETSAKQLVDRLKNKGYNAAVTEVQNNGKTWYRVRVGRYPTREEADKALETLKSKENFPNAFAASR
jgi:cell division protein FtsN